CLIPRLRGTDFQGNLLRCMLNIIGIPSIKPSIVPTFTTQRNIRALATSIRSAQPILVTGVAGVGKSYLLNQIAQHLNEHTQMISIHIGDQTDAKLLIGAYTSGDTPGSFEWRPGVLTTAV